MRPAPRAIASAVALAIVAVLIFWSTRPAPAHHGLAEAPRDTTTERAERGVPEAPVFEAPRRASPDNAAPSASATQAHGSFDAAAREAMRELVWHAFGREPPSAPERTHKTAYVLPKEPPHEPEGDAGSIDPKYIQEHVRKEFFDLAVGCYNDAMKTLPNPRGQVVFWFTIVGDEKVGGLVESVDVLDESTLRDPDMIECMRQSMLSVTFPPPKGGGFVTVKYPIMFSPGDD